MAQRTKFHTLKNELATNAHVRLTEPQDEHLRKKSLKMGLPIGTILRILVEEDRIKTNADQSQQDFFIKSMNKKLAG